jgi:threonine/homoserine/homoserine lactone efflux protein
MTEAILLLPAALLAYLGWRAWKHPRRRPHHEPHKTRLAGCASDLQRRKEFAAKRKIL